jgi:hypothetical protein
MTVVSLHGELRNLRDGTCKSCKRKFQIYANLVSSQAAEPAGASLSSMKQIAPSQGPTKSTFSWLKGRRLLKARASDHGQPSSSRKSFISNIFLPTRLPLTALSTPIYIPSPPPALTTSDPAMTHISIAPKPIVPYWYARAKPDAAADAALDVKFVRAFIHSSVRFVRFSADGRYLAAALTEGDNNALISIYDVETGNKTW